MNKYKLIILKIMDRFIRFMGLIGGAIIGVIGMIIWGWSDDVAIVTYGLCFVFCLLYCMEYNGEEWAI